MGPNRDHSSITQGACLRSNAKPKLLEHQKCDNQRTQAVHIKPNSVAANFNSKDADKRDDKTQQCTDHLSKNTLKPPKTQSKTPRL